MPSYVILIDRIYMGLHGSTAPAPERIFVYLDLAPLIDFCIFISAIHTDSSTLEIYTFPV